MWKNPPLWQPTTTRFDWPPSEWAHLSHSRYNHAVSLSQQRLSAVALPGTPNGLLVSSFRLLSVYSPLGRSYFPFTIYTCTPPASIFIIIASLRVCAPVGSPGDVFIVGGKNPNKRSSPNTMRQGVLGLIVADNRPNMSGGNNARSFSRSDWACPLCARRTKGKCWVSWDAGSTVSGEDTGPV